MKNRTLILMCAVFLCGWSPQKQTATVLIGGTRVNAEVAADQESRTRGLMYRENLAPGQGMLFVFPEHGEHGFWMKNMKFPIDIIWITPGMEIGEIVEEMQPCGDDGCEGITPPVDTAYVLEVEAGFAKKHNLAVGDRVTIEGTDARSR